MKRIILICFFFLLISLISFSQSRLGYSYQEIKTEFSKEKTSFLYIDKVTPCFIVSYFNIAVYYYFTDKFICNQTTIVAWREETAIEMVKTYDTNYTSIGDFNWKASFINGEIAYIKLVYNKDIGYVFTWK